MMQGLSVARCRVPDIAFQILTVAVDYEVLTAIFDGYGLFFCIVVIRILPTLFFTLTTR